MLMLVQFYSIRLSMQTASRIILYGLIGPLELKQNYWYIVRVDSAS